MLSLNAKLEQIARLTELNAGRDEFDRPAFFTRKLAEMKAARETAEIRNAKPAGYELPLVPKLFLSIATAAFVIFSVPVQAATVSKALADKIAACAVYENLPVPVCAARYNYKWQPPQTTDNSGSVTVLYGK